MRKLLQLSIFVLLILLVSTCQIQGAAALEIRLGRQSYLAGETFLATIQGDFIEQLKAQNIFFKHGGKEIGLAFYLLKTSEQEYYVWVNLPKQSGNYSFGIENIIYREDGKLSGKTKQVNFDINPSISLLYKDLVQETKDDWQGLSTEDNSLALLALAWHSQSSEGYDSLNSKSKDEEKECWPSSSYSSDCKVKETSLALIASAEFESEELNTAWLQDAQNNLDLGLWDLSVNSGSAQLCQIQINNKAEELNLSKGINTINLDLKNKPDEAAIRTNCSVSSAKIIHTYLGQLNEFAMQEQSGEYQVVLNNRNCFGQSYRSECDIESSAYAALAFDKLELDDNGLVDWLKANAGTTKHKALALYLSSSSSIKEWLINNQHAQGYWSSAALLESEEPDFEATVFSVMALEKRDAETAAEKGRLWLKEHIKEEGLKNKAAALAFAFTHEQIEPLITISPAAIKTSTESTVSIDIGNEGAGSVEISAEFKPFAIKKTLAIPSGSKGPLSFDVPSNISNKKIEDIINGSIELAYESKTSGKKASYSIPAIISPKKESEEKEPEILPEHFILMPNKINATLLVQESNLIEILLRNSAQRKIGNISISYTRSLKDIINIEPDEIDELESGESKVINVTVQHDSEDNFSGEIVAESSSQGISARIPLTLSFTNDESLVELPETIKEPENKTCRDFNGTVCKEKEQCDGIVVKKGTEKCCFGKCIKKSTAGIKIIGLIMVLLAVSIIAAFFYFKLKKPKKQAKDIYGEIEKKYSPKFSRNIEPKG